MKIYLEISLKLDKNMCVNLSSDSLKYSGDYIVKLAEFFNRFTAILFLISLLLLRTFYF